MKFTSHMIEGVPDANKKRCFDCIYCVGYISWWCENKEAIERRNTAIPGTSNCPQWAAVPHGKRSFWSKLFNRTIIEIKQDGEK